MIHGSLPNNVLASMSCGELFRRTMWYDVVNRTLCNKSGSGILRQLCKRIETRDFYEEWLPQSHGRSPRQGQRRWFRAVQAIEIGIFADQTGERHLRFSHGGPKCHP